MYISCIGRQFARLLATSRQHLFLLCTQVENMFRQETVYAWCFCIPRKCHCLTPLDTSGGQARRYRQFSILCDLFIEGIECLQLQTQVGAVLCRWCSWEVVNAYSSPVVFQLPTQESTVYKLPCVAYQSVLRNGILWEWIINKFSIGSWMQHEGNCCIENL